ARAWARAPGVRPAAGRCGYWRRQAAPGARGGWRAGRLPAAAAAVAGGRTGWRRTGRASADPGPETATAPSGAVACNCRNVPQLLSARPDAVPRTRPGPA